MINFTSNPLINLLVNLVAFVVVVVVIVWAVKEILPIILRAFA